MTQGGVRFRAELELHAKTATGLRAPPELVEALGSGKRPPVVVTLGEHTNRTTLGVMGGVPLVPVSAEHRAAAGVRAGEVLDVQLALDREPRTAELPPVLAASLGGDPEAQRRFAGLSPSNQRRHALAVAGATTDATRERRLVAVLAGLTG